MGTNYEFQPVHDANALLAHRVSAVFVLAFCEGRILAVQNERGWDIPGGHLEPGESPLDALRRELAEEAGASVKRICPIGTLSLPGAEKVMLLPNWATAPNPSAMRQFPAVLVGLRVLQVLTPPDVSVSVRIADASALKL